MPRGTPPEDWGVSPGSNDPWVPGAPPTNPGGGPNSPPVDPGNTDLDWGELPGVSIPPRAEAVTDVRQQRH